MQRRLRHIITVIGLVLGIADAAAAQSGSVIVVRADRSAIELKAADLAALPRDNARITAHDIVSNVEGPSLKAVLLKAGAGPIDTLRGPLLRRVVVVIASDGYRVVLPVSDLDVTLGNLRVLLVDRENGAALGPTDGPWRLVVIGDSRPARSVRMVTRIELVDLPGS
jgi:hypothetical protein